MDESSMAWRNDRRSHPVMALPFGIALHYCLSLHICVISLVAVESWESLDERIRLDGWIGMELLKFGFDYDGYGGDLEASVNGMVWNKPGSVKDVVENFGLEPLDRS